MKYILDNEGYIEEVSFGATIVCKDNTCTEYTGTIPDGYDNLCEWADNANIRAYKIVDGNLLYDPVRDSRLEKQYEQEEYDNTPVTNKELDKYMAGATKQFANSYKLVESLQNKISKLDNSNSFPIEKITINPNTLINDYLDLIVTNKNLLINEALNQTINGITFEVNEDRSININGTATADTEYNICGTSTNTSAFFVFKKGVNYYLSSNNYQIKMYNYDGTDRTEVYSGTGGSISFTDENKLVTQTVISIPSGTELNNITIYPQLEVGDAATEYISSESKSYSIDLNSNTFYKGGLFASEDTIIGETTIIKSGSLDTIIIDDGKITLYKESSSYELGEMSVSTFDDLSYIFTIQDTIIKASYRAKILYGTFQGDVYDNDNSEILGGRGLASTFQYKSGDGYDWLGFQWIPTGTTVSPANKYDLKIFINLPKNFVVTQAILTLKHNPVNYNSSVLSSSAFWGYSRNIEVYKSDGAEIFSVEGYEGFSIDTSSYEKINNAFGTNGFTAPVPTDTSYEPSTIEADITNYINKNGETILSIQPNYDIAMLDSSGNPTDVTNADLAKNTGTALAYVTIIGYVKYENEEE